MAKKKGGRTTPKGTVPPRHTRNTWKVRNTNRTIFADAAAAERQQEVTAAQALAAAVLRTGRR
jgi:hypothetical protein